MRRLLAGLVTAGVCTAAVALPALPARAEAGTGTAGSSWPVGLELADGLEGETYRVATADVTGDGVADAVRLLAADTSLFSLATTTSDGAGGLTTTTTPTYDLGDHVSVDDPPFLKHAVTDLVVGDVDEDGDVDAVVTLVGGSHRHQVFRNDGTGAWTPDPMATAESHYGLGEQARLADLDGDGHLDLLRSRDVLTVEAGDGTGAFAAPVVLTAESGTFDVGDLTGDDAPDIVLSGAGDSYSDVLVLVNDGSGGVSTTTTYDLGVYAGVTIAEVTGDGWNDLVAGVHDPDAAQGRLLSFRNAGDGTFPTTSVELAPYRVYGLRHVDVDGDGVRDLAGVTLSGPALLRRTGPNSFAARHAQGAYATDPAFADLTGDGRIDVVAAFHGEPARFWRGSADAAFGMEVLPSPPRVNTGGYVTFDAAVRNSPVPVSLEWSATRGTIRSDSSTRGRYTAPSSAAPAGSTVRVQASLPGTDHVASRELTVVNDRYRLTGLAGVQVRDVVADPDLPAVVYAATPDGVHRSTAGGADFAPLGTPPVSGGAHRLAVVRHEASGTDRVLALFGTALYRYDLAGSGGWEPAGTATAVSAVPGSPVVWAADGGQVRRSDDGGASWTALGGTAVTDVDAIDATSVWVTRSSAPRVSVGSLADGVLTLSARDLPAPAAAVTALTADPGDRASAYAGTADGSLYRISVTGPVVARGSTQTRPDRLSVGANGVAVAAMAGTQSVTRSPDSGASWHWVHIGLPTVAAVAHGEEGAELLGTSNGVYVLVDKIAPPAPTVTGGPSGTTGVGGADAFSFTFAGSGGTHLCALDGARWAPCTSPVTYSGPLGAGDHTFAVVTVGPNGYESEPGTRTWTVDATAPPTPEITAGPSGLVRSLNATFEFTLGGDAVGAVCALGGGTPRPCASGTTYSGLSQREQTFRVWAVNALGNRSAPATRTWTPDVQGPQLPIVTMVPSDYYTASTATSFSWYLDDEATYACTFDGTTTPCPSGSYSVSDVADGVHRFALVASDAAGNTVTRTEEWLVDTVAPEPPVLRSKPDETTRWTSAAFWFATPPVGMPNRYYYCAVDGAPAEVCYTTHNGTYKTYTGLGLGTHTVVVHAVDMAGRTSGTTTYEWVVTDEPAPADPVLTAGPVGTVRSTTATFAYTVPEGTGARCVLDAGPPTPCPTGGTTYEGLADGRHNFSVRTVAASGLMSDSTALRTWTVDTTPPAPPVLTAKPPGRTSSTSAAFKWQTEAAVSYHCAFDGVAVPCPMSQWFGHDVGEDTHQLSVTAKDHVGNVSAPTAHTWTVDRTGPVATLDAKPPALTGSDDARFELSSATADLDHWSCTVDGASRECDGSLDVTSLADGEHTFSATAHDDLGNAGEPVTYTWTVDTTAPAVTFGPGGTSLTAGRTVTFGEPMSGVGAETVRLLLGAVPVPASVSYDAAARRAIVTPSAPLVPGATYTVEVAGATDAAGNAVTASSPPFRVSASEQETSVAARASWRRTAWSGAQGGSYHVAHLRGQTATYAFTGTGITWYGVRGPSYGTADVYVDGVKRTTVSFWSPTAGVAYKNVGGLAPGPHTLRIVVRGEKGSPSGTGTDVAVDAFRAGGVTSATPAVAYGWARTLAKSASGGAYAVEDYAGATYSFTFRGTGVDWVTVAGPSMGKATVHVDGVLKGTVDNYAPTLAYGVVRRFGGLADTRHTVTITVLRQRRSGSAGYGVAVDRFGVLP